MIITAPHNTESNKLAEVVAEMKTMGAPTIRVAVIDGDDWQALEGSHRVAAAKLLGLVPNFVQVNLEDVATGHDFQDLPSNATWQDVLDYLRDGSSFGPGYEF